VYQNFSTSSLRWLLRYYSTQQIMYCCTDALCTYALAAWHTWKTRQNATSFYWSLLNKITTFHKYICTCYIVFVRSKTLYQHLMCGYVSYIKTSDIIGKGKGKVVPLQARCGPQGSRKFRLPEFHDIRHMKVVRSSASRTGRLYPQECSWY